MNRFGEIVRLIVNQDNTAVEKQLAAEPRYAKVKVVYGKGLFFKLPFIETVEMYDYNLITFDTEPREAIAKDKKKLILDS